MGGIDSNLNPEDRLCLLLAQGRLPPSAREEVLSLLARALRWDRFVERAQQHEVYPLAFCNLKDLGFRGVPDQTRRALEALFRMNSLRNHLLAEELAALLRTLHQAGIAAVPLKGLFLSELLYGDTNRRVCADLDILVSRRNLAQAFDLLLGKGYQAQFPRWFLTDFMARSNFEYLVQRQDRGIRFLVELHSGLLWEPRADQGSLKDLWAEARPGVFRGAPAYIPSPEWQFLCLAVHAARHNWQGLKWLVDIHELCQRGGICWEKVAAKTRQLAWKPLVQRSLGACHALLDTPLPAGFAGELPADVALYPAPPVSATPWQNTLLSLRLTKRPSDKLRFLLRRLLIPTPTDGKLWRLPSSLVYLYYLLRPFRLGSELAGSLLSAARRNILRRSRTDAVSLL